MLKKIDKLMKALVLVALLYAGKVKLIDMKTAHYFRTTVTQSVAPAKKQIGWFSRNIGTTFQLAYEGWQYTITNMHVCDAYNDYMPVGDEILKILFIDPIHDICVLESSHYRPYLELADEDAKINDNIHLVGHPRGLAVTVRDGYVIDKAYGVFPWLLHRFPVGYIMVSSTSYPGNSGSPVLDDEGKVIGILFAGRRGYHTEGYVIPRKYIEQALDRLRASE
jgi:S1-C subfamily serine protease